MRLRVRPSTFLDQSPPGSRASGAADGASSVAFWTMDLQSASGPLYGTSTLHTGHEAGYDHSFNAGGGVGGRNAVDIVLTPVSLGGAPASDMRCGWNGVPGWPSFSQGDSLFCQAYLAHIASDPCENAVDGGAWSGKEIIIGGSADTWRMIHTMDSPDWPTNHAFTLSKNIDGPPASTWDESSFSQKLILPNNTNFALQWEVKTGPTSGGGGRLNVWVNNDTYASPTRVSGTDLALDATQMFGQPDLWAAINPVLTGSTLTIRISYLAFSKQFDSTLHARM